MIYICIPTHNEQQTVGVVLWKLRQVLTEFPRDYQLLVADDASTDKTAEVLEPYTRVLPLTVIRSEQRQGTAASLEMLLREAVRRSEYPKRDVIVTLQADFSEEPDDLVPLVKRLEAGADVAVGNKVSATKDARSRRLARSLARFFMRRQKWPDGVETPFDGYRAYRLYSVKRAMETRGNARLIRHDSWACHAELLRAVMPNARRVDVIDIDDRPDRLQRPRREKPFASAMQVRVLASGAEPPDLVAVEELDRIALTASRSRERAAITAQSLAESGAGSLTNGSRTRPGARRDQGRSRSQSNGSARTRPDTDGARPRRERSRKTADAAASSEGGRGGRTAAGGRTRSGQRDQAGQTETPYQGRASAAEQAEAEELTAQSGVAPDATQKPKRKRRRRKRGGQGRTAGEASTGSDGEKSADRADGADADGEQSSPRSPRASSSSEAPAGGTEEAGTNDGAEGVAEDGAPKKRRRRGGRRGGRGRRKPRPEAAEGSDSGAPVEAGAAREGAESAADGPARPESGVSAEGSGPAERPEGVAERPERPAPRVESEAVRSAERAVPAERSAPEPVTRPEND